MCEEPSSDVSSSLAVDEAKVEASGQLSHPELLSRVSHLVSTLLDDPFLSGLPRDVTAEEVTSLLALEQGKAITVYVKRFDQELIREYFIVLTTERVLFVMNEKATVCCFRNNYCKQKWCKVQLHSSFCQLLGPLKLSNAFIIGLSSYMSLFNAHKTSFWTYAYYLL